MQLFLLVSTTTQALRQFRHRIVACKRQLLLLDGRELVPGDPGTGEGMDEKTALPEG